MTSHDVVAQVKRGLKKRGITAKVGHAGTLDPMAEGVLLVCVGNATRLSEYVMNSTKGYRAQIRLGSTTDTYDAEGTILVTRTTDHLTCEQVQAALNPFIGQIEQVPPMYSAIKQGGKKLYELARAGQTVERQPRAVTIHTITLLDCTLPEITLDITCSAGTYIRSLAYDLGEALHVGGHLTALTRTRSGQFHVAEAVILATLLEQDAWQPYLISPRIALSDWTQFELDVTAIQELRYGRRIPRDPQFTAETVLGFSATGELVAILEAVDSQFWQPMKVFAPTD